MTETAYLERGEDSESGTFGRMYFGDHSLFSGELPDRNNAPNVSRIPEGAYTCLWTYSPAFKRMMYLVDDVEGRSGIRIHSANYMGDRLKGLKCHLYGCIALGKRVGTIKGQKALLVSRPAIRMFQDFMNGKSFRLEII